MGEALRAANEGTRVTAWIVFITAIVVAFLTALYMTRVVVKTFGGEYRGHGRPHESPGSMVSPLWVLAVGSLTVGFLGFPVIGPFKSWITVPGHEHPGFSTFYNIVLPVASVAIAAAGVALGWQLFARNRWRTDILKSPFGWSYTFVQNKYFMDDFYLGGIVRPIQYRLSKGAYWFNQHVIDAVVNGSARGSLAASRGAYGIDQHVVDSAVNGAAGITGWSGGLLRYVQTGHVQRYAAVLFAAIALFVGLLAFT